MLVAHRTDAVVGFIHAIPSSENVLTLRSLLRAENNLSLHLLRYFAPCQCHHGRREIKETNEIFAYRLRFDMPWPADNQRNVNALVIDPAFAARQAAAMIASQKHNGIVGDAGLFQSVE